MVRAMNIRMGSQTFLGVSIPVLWGTRAILQGADGTLSVIDLAGDLPRPEIVDDRPAAGVSYLPQSSGFQVLGPSDEVLYVYEPARKRIAGVAVPLPDLEISHHGIRVGTNSFHSNVVSGHPVGIAVTETSISLGAELPKGITSLSAASPRSGG